MNKKIGDDRRYSFEDFIADKHIDRQTDRQTDTLITILRSPIGVEVTNTLSMRLRMLATVSRPTRCSDVALTSPEVEARYQRKHDVYS